VNSSRPILRTVLVIFLLIVILGGGVFFWQNSTAISAYTTPPTRALLASAPTNTPESPAASPTLVKTYTPGPSPTIGDTATATPVPTKTPIPTQTPTSRPQIVLTLDATLAIPTLLPGVPTPETPIPTAVSTFEVPSKTTNILLLGNDTPNGGESRTDTIIIVAINRDGPTASILSIPRDLYVYIPGSIMNRINTAVARGDEKDYSGGGVALLEQTILYNFGIPIHYYARIDFAAFQEIVDTIGGVDIAASCRLQDWRLKSPELDINEEDNYEQFALEPGIYHMDGDLALWYARSRRTTSDFDRGRRQQQILRAMFNQGLDLNLLPQVPSLWNTYKEKVETDIDIGLILQLAALAPQIRENGIQNLYLGGKVESWVVPSSGAQVLLPIWEGDDMMQETMARLFQPPALSRSNRAPITVEIINATDNPDLPLLAADNLATHGFIPIISPDKPQENAQTQISYYGANFKGSYDWLLSWIFNAYRSSIELVTDQPDYPYDYRVVLGENYNPCRPELYAPVPN
jgi:polyisoprenyl-teichoic acid--peptidoglycan teichoic acid transferase